MSGKARLVRVYSPHYQEQCFQAWYLAGRPNTYTKIVSVIPEDDRGRKPSDNVLAKWRDELNWDIRADALDAKASAIIEDDLVTSRIQMFHEQASRAKELQVMGLDYLRENSFDSSSSAVGAVIRGAELERVSKGLSEHMIRLLQMNDEQLAAEAQKLLERENIPPSQILDAEEDKSDETDDE